LLWNGEQQTSKARRDERKVSRMSRKNLSRNAPYPCGSDRVLVRSIADLLALGYNPL